jgi:hypothetical protein
MISDCGSYRYALWRSWDNSLETLLFIGLNPSRADAVNDDPTLRRCMGFARSWGFGSVALGNLFGWRSTDPRALREVADPVGPENDRWLAQLADQASLVVGAWGTKGGFRERDAHVGGLVGEIHSLGCTVGGHPRHPLYVPGDRQPQPWYGLAA